MTGFIQSIIKNPSRSIRLVNKAAATAIDQNELLAYDSGLAVPATAATVSSGVIGVATRDIAAAEGLTQVEVIEIFDNDVFVVDSTNASDADHNGQRMVLTDSIHVNNTGTTNADGIVEQVDVYGATTDKKILVKFVK